MLDQTATQTATAATKKAAQITERKLVWKGAVVEIKIPTESFCRVAGYKDFWYMQFGRVISSGNIINMFLHADVPQDYCYKKIRAEIEVHLKRFDDGRCYHHIDLRPTEKPVNHKLKVLPSTDEAKEDGVIVLPLEHPQVGEILLTPLASHNVAAVPAAQPDSKESTGYPVLDRMLSQDGWMIEKEDKKLVYLYKGEGVGRRTTKFQKPKKKR